MKRISLLIVFTLILSLLTSCSNMKVSEMKDELAKNIDTIKEEVNEVTESVSTDFLDNEFFDVLNEIKDVHPGTAGCSLKSLYAGVAILNVCKLRLPFDTMLKSWLDSQDKSSLTDIKDSFSMVLESIKELKDGDSEKILVDNGIENENTTWDKAIFETAENLLNMVVGSK